MYVGYITIQFFVLDGISENDWISLKMVDLFSEFTVLCSAVSDICSDESCPTMAGKGGTVYYWMDPNSTDFSRPTAVSARRYMDLLMKWAESYLDLFSGSVTHVPAGAFAISIKVFCRRFFRIFVHLFCHHSEQLIPVRKHLKYSLFHFLIFMREFNLLISKKEAEPLIGIIDSLKIPTLSFPSE